MPAPPSPLPDCPGPPPPVPFLGPCTSCWHHGLAFQTCLWAHWSSALDRGFLRVGSGWSWSRARPGPWCCPAPEMSARYAPELAAGLGLAGRHEQRGPCDPAWSAERQKMLPRSGSVIWGPSWWAPRHALRPLLLRKALAGGQLLREAASRRQAASVSPEACVLLAPTVGEVRLPGCRAVPPRGSGTLRRWAGQGLWSWDSSQSCPGQVSGPGLYAWYPSVVSHPGAGCLGYDALFGHCIRIRRQSATNTPHGQTSGLPPSMVT